MDGKQNCGRKLAPSTIGHFEQNYLSPRDRLQKLSEYGITLPIKAKRGLSLERYYQYCIDTYDEAVKLLKKQDLENAYLCLLKFLDLMENKLRHHPNDPLVKASVKSRANAKLRFAQHHVKKVKQELLERYRKMADMYQCEGRERCLLAGSDSQLSSVSIQYGCDRMKSILFKHFKTVVVPAKLPTLFQIMTQLETRNRIQQMGVLAGVEDEKQYVITHLIVPDKFKRAFLCVQDMDDTDEVRDYIREHELLSLGWIHTHCADICFMSSLDHHKHSVYQREIHEAISVVCSPLHDQVEYYSMSDYGLRMTQSCHIDCSHVHRQTEPMYVDAGHVLVLPADIATLEIVDFRKFRCGLKVAPLPRYL